MEEKLTQVFGGPVEPPHGVVEGAGVDAPVRVGDQIGEALGAVDVAVLGGQQALDLEPRLLR